MIHWISQLPVIHDEHTIAYIIDATTGDIVDEAGNFETAMNFIQDTEHIALAVADETHWCTKPAECSYCQTYGNVIRTQEALQAAFDYERALQEDCFGLRHVEAVAA